MSGLFDASALPGDLSLSLPTQVVVTTNNMYAKVFNFGVTFAGFIVEAQVLDVTFTPITAYSVVNVVESGAGQYAMAFSLPAGFTGYVRARVQSQPLVVDTYEVNIPASTTSLVVASNNPTVLLVTGS